MTIDDELEALRPKAWVPYGNHIWLRRDDYEALEEFARGQAERLTAVETQNDRLRRLLHREHFFEAGRLGFKPPLYGEPCPPCNGVDEELAALASVPGATGEGAED